MADPAICALDLAFEGASSVINADCGEELKSGRFGRQSCEAVTRLAMLTLLL